MEPQVPGLDLSVVIVNYNVRYFLEQALYAVRRAVQGLRVEIFVVDNNSVDDSLQMLREKFPEVLLIANTENTGFARANNQAIRLARGKYVLLLNPDTLVEENTFTACFAFMEAHPDAGALGVRMIDGAGKFLPESLRGFPTPFAAFCKMFGLSALFPRSRFFNYYYLGHLDPSRTQEADVLAGAFMWIRHSALDRAGLLDEAFFMYGEDIDLSWRIVQAGYKNYYFPGTTIIHYKGESTKKGSLNYVRTFYQAMIIFAKKHFVGREARLFVGVLQTAIYFRAALTVLRQGARRLAWPLVDMLLFAGGLAVLKHVWAMYRFHDPGYYPASFLYFNLPLYVGLWCLGIFLSGGYDTGAKAAPPLRGVWIGTLFIAVVYGFLNQEYRTSRALVVMGAAWSLLAVVAGRTLSHLLRHGNVDIWTDRPRNTAIVGSEAECGRIQGLLRYAPGPVNYLGAVSVGSRPESGEYLGELSQLGDIVRIYRIEEVIFASRDVPASQITRWMAQLGPEIAFKIAPEESLSIIGSPSKDSPGELYTIDIRYRVASVDQRRNKRLFDLAVCAVLIALLPLAMALQHRPLGLPGHIWRVMAGYETWVAYAPTLEEQVLPRIRRGVLTPALGLPETLRDQATVRRLNFLYAKEYSMDMDLRLVLRHFRTLGS